MTTFEETKNLEESVDSESFIKADMESDQKDETEGIAVMKKLHYAKDSSEIPEEYKGLIFPRDNTEFYILECEDSRTSEDMTLVVRQGEHHNELDMLKEWADVDSVSRLAGKTVPVKQTQHEDLYEFPRFKFNFIDSDMQSVRDAYESGWIEYNNGKWTRSKKIEEYDNYMDKRMDQMGSAFWILLGFSFFSPVPLISSVFLMTAISIFLGQSYLNSRDKPISFIQERI